MFFLNIFQIGKKTFKFDLGILHQMLYQKCFYLGKPMRDLTSKSLIQCVQFLLNAGMKHVLTDIFSQDRLENSFGKQRAIGRRDNPNLWAVGYNDNIIKSQFTISPIGGNVQSEYNASKIDTTPVPRRNRTNKIQFWIYDIYACYVTL